ncbi:MAG: hypothetical protein KY453_12325, partial [Gemmatimonadetes bacterium]|nr:hypothetical protein [Gemmatimonadota bacterium]
MLQPHARSMARLRAALEGDHVLVPCRDWRDVWDAVQARGVDGCVVEMTAESRGTDLRQLQRLRRHRPPLALVVEADFSGREIDLF